MSEVLQSNGLVLYLNNGDGYYPFACAKTSTITIDREVIELAPKTNNAYKRYIKGRNSFTVSGNGLITLFESFSFSITNLDSYIEGTDYGTGIIQGRFEMTNPSGLYKKYSFEGIFTNLTLDSTIGQSPTYSFIIQGTGAFTEIP